MGGGLMQLVAYGAQDIYLTGNPQITFFKVVYRRHTNFSMEAIEQTFDGTIGAGASDISATISRNGDLVSRLWLDVDLPSGSGLTGEGYFNWTNNTGHALVKKCEIEIGGQLIDRHYSEWLDVWNELTDHDEAEWQGLNKHSAKKAYLHQGGEAGGIQLYIPLQFWFCRNPGLALPLIALQYHEVKIKVTTRPLLSLINTDHTAGTLTLGKPNSFKLWADYIYLDTDERRRFAQVSHEYLIEQLQMETNSMSTSQSLNFNHPVKELIWFTRDTNAGTENVTTAPPTLTDASKNFNGTIVNNNDYFCYESTTGSPSEVINGQTSLEAFRTMKLLLNGHDRFAPRNASYFRTCQPLQAGHKVPSKHIYCYSFALKPEDHQPSGTCNFSRIDNAQMLFTNNTTSGSLTVFAINYNVLRIMSGMGGLAYSN
jgi:hypothetical protein